MSFQECFNQLPSSEKAIILQMFRKWTAWDAERGGLKINQLLWEHLLPCTDIQATIAWMIKNLTDRSSLDETFAALKNYLRHQHQSKGGAIRTTSHPRFIGTASPRLRFFSYLEEHYKNRFGSSEEIMKFINNQNVWAKIKSLEYASIPFRKTAPGWYFWNEPGFPSLIDHQTALRTKSEIVKLLGLDQARFGSDKLLLFFFDVQELIDDGFTLFRPTFGDAACNLQFLSPPHHEKRFGLTVPSSTPAYAWRQTAGLVGGAHPERSMPEGVVQTEELLLKHIVHYRIFD